VSIDDRPDPDSIQNVAERQDVLTNLMTRIRACHREADLLAIAVESARQGVECDRVVVYSLKGEAQGEIVAESVVPAFPQTFGRTIYDPCFTARYIDKYQRGRVQAIADIYTAGMTPCYLENLEKIKVRACLVVPILSAPDRLFGLLVFHHCRQAHQWQSGEIDLAIQIATQIGIALENLDRAATYHELAIVADKTAQWQSQILTLNEKIYAAQNRRQVLDWVAIHTRKLLECDRAIVYSLHPNSTGKIIAEATNPALAAILGKSIIDPCFEYRYTEQYQNGRVRAIDDIHQAGMSNCYIETLTNIGVKSNLVAPILLANGKLLGLLVAHECFQTKVWQPKEIEALRQIAIHCGLAVNSARIREKQAALTATTAMLAQTEIDLQQTIALHQANVSGEDELADTLSQIGSLARMLERESIESTQSSPEESYKLLQIIASKLLEQVDRGESVQQKLSPKQREIGAFLRLILESIESCRST
jgi:GAF domain-containing protein